MRARGGVAVQILGAALFLLLLIGGVGLLEARRALAFQAMARASLQAALESASASPTPEETFRWYLSQNLGGQPFQASLARRAPGESDPQTGEPLNRPLLTGSLHIPYRFAWLGRGAALRVRVEASVWQEE